MQQNTLLIFLLALFAFILYHVAYFIGYYSCFKNNRELILRPKEFAKTIEMLVEQLEKDKLNKE